MFETVKGIVNNVMLDVSLLGANKLSEEEFQKIIEHSKMDAEDLDTVSILEKLGYGCRSQYLYDFAHTLQEYYPDTPIAEIPIDEIAETTGYRVCRIEEAVNAMIAYRDYMINKVKNAQEQSSDDQAKKEPETAKSVQQTQPKPQPGKKPAAKKQTNNKTTQPEDLVTKPFDVLAGATN